MVDPFPWIEQVTGLDPDHGSGILETALSKCAGMSPERCRCTRQLPDQD